MDRTTEETNCGRLSTTLGDLQTDLSRLTSGMEADLEAILDHPCHATLENIDPETGEVLLRVELDLSELERRLQNEGEYDGVDIGIHDDFVFRLSPSGEP